MADTNTDIVKQMLNDLSNGDVVNFINRNGESIPYELIKGVINYTSNSKVHLVDDVRDMRSIANIHLEALEFKNRDVDISIELRQLADSF